MMRLLCSPVTPSAAFVHVLTQRLSQSNGRRIRVEPFFLKPGTVTIGPYEGRLDYSRLKNEVKDDKLPGPSVKPDKRPLGIVRIDQPRGLLLKLFDKLFHGIRFDGTRDLTCAESRAFGQLQTSIEKAIRTSRRDKDYPARANELASTLRLHADPGAARREFEQLLSTAIAKSTKLNALELQAYRLTVWPGLIARAAVPEVSRRLWTWLGQLKLIDMLSLCPDMPALEALASTHENGKQAGLLQLARDAALMTALVEPLLIKHVESKPFANAMHELRAWFTDAPQGPNLFCDSFGMSQCGRLAKTLRNGCVVDRHREALVRLTQTGTPYPPPPPPALDGNGQDSGEPLMFTVTSA